MNEKIKRWRMRLCFVDQVIAKGNMAGQVLNQECNAGGGDCGMQCNESERVRGLELGLVLSDIYHGHLLQGEVVAGYEVGKDKGSAPEHK